MTTRTCPVALALVVLGLLSPPTSSASSSDALRPDFPAFTSAQATESEREIGGEIVILQGGEGSGEGGCGYTVPVLRYPAVEDAIRYIGVVADTYYGDRTIGGPPFQDDSPYGQAPAGTHQHELAGLFGNGDAAGCGEAAAYYRGRLAVKSVVAVVPLCSVSSRRVLPGRSRLHAAKEKKENCEPAKISGRVVTSYGEPVGNVKIEAKPAAGPRPKPVFTGDAGLFNFTLKKPANKGRVVLTPKPLGDQKITPKSITVTVEPGKTKFAKFVAETAIVHGTVDELACPAEPSRKSCRRDPRSGAVVQLEGDGVREPKFATTQGEGSDEGPLGSYSFKVPPGKYKVRVARLDVAGSADVCEDDKRLPVIVKSLDEDAKPAECASAIARTGKPEYTGRETVTVQVKAKEKGKADFVAIPHRAVPVAELATFKHGKGHAVNEVTSGLVDPFGKSGTSPEVFGRFASAGGEYVPIKSVIQCQTGCATVNVLVTNLLGEPLKGAQVQLTADPVTPPESAVGVDDGGPTNLTGEVCFVARNRAGDCAAKQGPTDRAGRALGLYAAPGVVSGVPVAAAVRVLVPAQGVPSRGSYPEAFTGEPIRILSNRRVRKTMQLTKAQIEFLDRVTDPTIFQIGINNWSRKLCRTVIGQLEKLLDGAPAKPDVRDWCDRDAPQRPEPQDPNMPPMPDLPQDQTPQRDLPASDTEPVENFLQNGAIGLTLLKALKVRTEGLGEAFGLPEVRGVLRFSGLTGPANRSLGDFVRQMRVAQGGRITKVEPITLDLYEVSRLANVSGSALSAQPALFADLRTPSTRWSTVISQGYNPVAWLNP